MLRNLPLGIVLIGIAARVAAANDAPKLKPVILPDAVHYVQLFSTDNHVGSMIFDNFVVGTEIGKGSLPSVVTKKLTYVVFPDSTKEVCVKTSIMGYVNTMGSGSASVLIHAAGKATLVDLEKAIATAKTGIQVVKTEHHQRALKAARDQGIKTDRARGPLDNDFLQTLDIRLPPGKPLQVTISLLVDRLPGDDGSGALLTIDSIDFEVTPVPAAK